MLPSAASNQVHRSAFELRVDDFTDFPSNPPVCRQVIDKQWHLEEISRPFDWFKLETSPLDFLMYKRLDQGWGVIVWLIYHCRNRVCEHFSGRIWFQQVLEVLQRRLAWIKPERVGLGRDDHRHPVMNLCDQLVWSCGDNCTRKNF